LLEAPHRLAFVAGLWLLVCASLWWATVLALRFAAVAVPWQVSPSTAHALLMVYGFMPLFIAGFLFTAGPRWLLLPPVPVRSLLPPVLSMLLGWCAVLIGVHTGARIAACGLALAGLGFAHLSARFHLLLRRSRVPDRHHAQVVALGNAATVVGWSAAAPAVALERDARARAAAYFGLFSGVGLVFVSVAHRMIPFFTAAALPALDAWRPRALLMILVALVGVQGLWFAADALIAGASMPPALLWLRAAVEWAAGALLLWLALRWGLVQSLRIRLLAKLHMGFFWLGVAFVLAGASHALMAGSAGEVSLGLAPLHAFTMGYLGSMLMAMATRVICGHGGRAVVADNAAWALFWLLQAAVWCRLVAALAPAVQVPFTLLAAGLWGVSVAAWALREGRTLLRSRAQTPRRHDRPPAPGAITWHGRLRGSTRGEPR
jgi:uncharacterized protein involved in response to NO